MAIKIYLETHREACLDGIYNEEELEASTAEYDNRIVDYIAYLQGLAKEERIEIETTDRNAGRSYHSDTDKEDIWMMNQMCFWEWYHSYQPSFTEDNSK